MMGRRQQRGSTASLGVWVLLMLSNSLVVVPVFSSNVGFEDEKNYYSPDPHTAVPTPSTGSHSHHGSSHHGSGSTPSNCGTPPVSGGGGGGHYYPSPEPKSPPVGGGGGHYYPSPKPKSPTPSGGGCSCPTPPSTPRGGGGGGYYRPPPSTPTPVAPIVPSPPIVTPTPVTPVVPSPPVAPVTPTPYDPNTPPFTCTYWGSHPTLIFGVVGWWATVGGLFGVTTLPGLSPSSTTLQQVLNDPKTDGYSSLYKEATASFLNSMAAKSFPFSTNQVKDSLLASLYSDKAASSQARVFKLANEGRLKIVY